ncbi:MAG: lysylphosphatidylglycerol synthase transmembrane domain-containing protein [Actinomycetota bacterium]|nr:lysylphosphatidylglycerol synthase transmembrane domain-containing protein [Actinomycetota bacterium]
MPFKGGATIIEEHEEQKKERRKLWRKKGPMRRFAFGGAKGVLIVLVLEYLVFPQIAGARKDIHVLSTVNIAWIGLGIALEVAALVAYAKLTEAMLPKGAISFSKIFRIDLAALATSHIIPAGTAGGTGLSIRLMTNVGARTTDAAFAIATQGIGSAVVLNAILWVALIVSIPLHGLSASYAIAVGLGLFVFTFFILTVIALTRGEDRIARIIVRLSEHIKFIRVEKLMPILARVALRIKDLESNPDLLRRAVIFAFFNWILDAASLWVFMAAFGYYVNPDALLVSYGLANVLAAIPITPGGLGVIEGVLTSTLVGFGSPRAIAILGVIGYRLINFWLPIPIGGLVSLGLGKGPVTLDDQEDTQG